MEIDREYASEILTEASRLIRDVKKQEHGDSFSMTAAMWSTYLGIEISEADFCIMMALLKITRLKMGKKIRDHFMDGAAYMALAGGGYAEETLPNKSNPSFPAKVTHHPEGYIP